ncbi:MAG: thioredoxin-like protein [Candidatus Peregrinibacteria bacterium GW2011_GWF2_33_10]|nr:MAG: thioredoxin-like protein [Candidatus Peregrinibacteria bacterium GW2011_GWF2_33_10]
MGGGEVEILNLSMTLLESEKIILGSEIPNFKNLPEVNGEFYSLTDFVEAEVLVVIFMCNHCPYVQAVLDRINSLAYVYRSKGVQFIGINSNDSTNYPDDSFENMKQIARKLSFQFLYLLDESQQVAKDFGAVCTPDIFVYKKNINKIWQLKYHGAIDDNWQDFFAVTKHYLRDVLEELLTNEKVSFEQKSSMGCSIKWKQ